MELIQTQQLPTSKKTKGDHTKLKLLHNQYTQGKLYIDNQGLVLIKTPDGAFNGSVISVPPSMFPGVINALHIRLDHPSKSQLIAIVSRYFYTPGWRSVIEDVSDNCYQCASVRKLPKVLLDDTTTTPEGLATNFSADIIERHQQKILIIRENLSQYTRGVIIPDQKTETLQEAILQLVTDLIPDSGTNIRVDGATSFQGLKTESENPSSIFHKLKISITIGRLLSKNKNPEAENANKEVLKEILRLTKKTWTNHTSTARSRAQKHELKGQI